MSTEQPSSLVRSIAAVPVAVCLWFIAWNAAVGSWGSDDVAPAPVSLPTEAELEKRKDEYLAKSIREWSPLRPNLPVPIEDEATHGDRFELARKWLELKDRQLDAIRQRGIHPETIDCEIASLKEDVEAYDQAPPNESWPRAQERRAKLWELREELAWFESKKLDGTPVTRRHELPFQRRLDELERMMAYDYPIGTVGTDWTALTNDRQRTRGWFRQVYDWLRKQTALALMLLCGVIGLITFVLEGIELARRRRKTKAAVESAGQTELTSKNVIGSAPQSIEQVELSLRRSSSASAADVPNSSEQERNTP